MPRARARRFRRFFIIVQGVTLASHAVLAVALASVAGVGLGLLGTGALATATALRLRALVHDGRRPAWVTRVVDQPVFVHWGACLLSVFFFLVVAPLAFALRPDRAWGTAACAAYAGGAAIAAWGVWGRRRFVRIHEVDVPIRKLPPAFAGYRVVHLTDLHIGSFDAKERGLEWAKLANALEPDLVAVTGDLVTTGTAFYDDVAEVLAALRARDGVVVSLGNHDQWDAELLTRKIDATGVRVLRNGAQMIRRGDASIACAGIDDRFAGRSDLEETLRHCPPEVPKLLLSHYPDFFEAAAARGVDLVLSGHTHGGQVGVPFVDRWNLAELTRQRSRGLYDKGDSRLYVSAGLGTTGPPLRLGVAPEIALLVLRPA